MNSAHALLFAAASMARAVVLVQLAVGYVSDLAGREWRG